MPGTREPRTPEAAFVLGGQRTASSIQLGRETSECSALPVGHAKTVRSSSRDCSGTHIPPRKSHAEAQLSVVRAVLDAGGLPTRNCGAFDPTLDPIGVADTRLLAGSVKQYDDDRLFGNTRLHHQALARFLNVSGLR